jgi:serine-threonine kinase receptor-associated protein
LEQRHQQASFVSDQFKVPLLCRGHSRPVVDVEFSAVLGDGSFMLISACLDGKPMLRDGVTGDWVGTFEGHKGAVWCARLNEDATQAITASGDYTCKVWNAIDGSELFSFAHKRAVKTAAFARDRGRIVTGGQEGVLRVFDLERPDAEPVEFGGRAHSAALRRQKLAAVQCARWLGADDSAVVSSGSADAALLVWDPRDPGAPARRIGVSASAPVASFQLCHGGAAISYGVGDTVSLIDAATFRPLHSWAALAPRNNELNSAHFHPTRPLFVTGGSDFRVRLYAYDPDAPDAPPRLLEQHAGHHGPVHAVRFSPDGSTFASSSEDGTVRLWLVDQQDYGLWKLSI